MSLIRKDISNIEAYKPGKPIEEVQRELGLRDVIKLASNENPLGPSPRATSAITKALKNLNRYPDGSCFYLKKKLSQELKVKEENLLLGNGSDELIDIILKTIKEDGAGIVTADVTFVEYKITAAVDGMTARTVPLRDFTFDLEAMARSITPGTKAVFIANPNNPTGTYVTRSQVEAFLGRIPPEVLVVFDEAYTEYVDAQDFPDILPYVGKKNVAILRTFSKIYGLAGLRIGVLIADADFVAQAQRVRQPFNVNALAQAAALAALDDKAFVSKSRNLVLEEKKKLYAAFRQMGVWFKESAANFVFVRFDKDVKTIFGKLLKKGVIIRDMDSYGLANYARITIGTSAENERLIKALRDTLEEIS